MDIEARIDVLRGVSVFEGLDRTALAALARAARERPFRQGDTPFLQGDPADTHYVVAWGRLRLDQTTPDGRNLVLRFLGPGALLGSVAVLRGVPYPATPTAVEDGMLLAWGAGGFADLMQAYPAIGVNALKMVGGRLEDLQARLTEIATQRVERRIAATLLRLVREAGRPAGDGVEIPYGLSRAEIAEMSGTTLHTVSRTLAAWEQAGILTGKRGAHLVVARPERLEAIAGGA